MTSERGVLERLTEALRDRYAVEGEIARGGMATVYRARDLDHDRPVAIKVMDPRLAAALGARRFLREVALARSMMHPHIIPLYDSGDADGILYYVMPYIEGETLFQRLQRENRLAVGEALRITQDIADGLAYAHGLGLLHRDVKPENILLSDSGALVADFGLAKAVGNEFTRLTRTGVIVGTVHYMSPEQLREDDLDQRADIYSLGCIVYEMLTGGPPYVAASLKELVTRIIAAPVPSLRQFSPEIPVAVDAAVSRALAKAATARFISMREFAAAVSTGAPR